MKKLMLVPILALSLLTGCNQDTAPTVTLDMWLEHYDDTKLCRGYCSLYDKDFKSLTDWDADEWDYDNYVLKAIKKGAEQSTRVNKRPKTAEDSNIICYLLQSRQECGAEGCFIYVFDNYIMTFTDFYYNRKYTSQRCYYEFDNLEGKGIIDSAIARADVIKNTTIEEENLAIREAKIENFLEKAEAATTASIEYSFKTLDGENRSLLNVLKTTEYDDEGLMSYVRGIIDDYQTLAVYNLDEHLSLRIGNEKTKSTKNGVENYTIAVCYHYKPTFTRSSYYEEGKYGIRKPYHISKESYNQIKAILDSLKTA